MPAVWLPAFYDPN
jgi:hypothetical protein